MENTTGLDYMAILKSVAKVEDDKYEYMVSAEDAIEAMKLAVEESRKWISVKDKLPDEGHRVLCINEDTRWIDVAHLVTDYFTNELRWTNHSHVTHWSELPEHQKSEPLKKMLGI